jgi:hypothetical protein
VLAGPLVAIITMATAVAATQAAGVPLRDPDHVAGRRLLIVAAMVLALVVVDILVRAARRSPGRWPAREAIREVRGERWTRYRALAVVSALVSFYVTYLAYRNLKSVVPLLRPGELFDRQLGEIDRAMFGGTDPAAILHTLLGTGITAEGLSIVYVVFIVFLPISLAYALVYSPDLPGGLFFATALGINWSLGALSYFVLPALGPVYVSPAEFADLPTSEVSQLQALLLDQRVAFLRDPAVAGTSQSIAAFASLHVSVILTAVLAAYLLGFGRRTRLGLWVLLWSSVLATVYLGWHYVIDDVAGVAIALLALWLASKLTGFRMDPKAFRSRKSRGRSSGRASRSRPSA